MISEECTIPDAWQNKMFSITSTLNDNSSANFNKSISFGVSTAIWKEPDSFSSWRCHYVDNSSIVLKRCDICMRGSREGSGIQIDSFLQNSHCKIIYQKYASYAHPPPTNSNILRTLISGCIYNQIHKRRIQPLGGLLLSAFYSNRWMYFKNIYISWGFFFCSSFSTAISDDDNITFHCLLHKTINESLIYLHAIQGKLNMHAFILTAGHVLYIRLSDTLFPLY